MDPDRWKQIDNLLQAALQQPRTEREEFLRRACAGDEALEREVRSLLVSHQEAGSFLESPAIEEAARAIVPEQLPQAHDHTPFLVGQSISRYCIVEKLGGGGWAWSTKPRTLDSIVSWLSSFFLMKSLEIPRHSLAFSVKRGRLQP